MKLKKAALFMTGTITAFALSFGPLNNFSVNESFFHSANVAYAAEFTMPLGSSETTFTAGKTYVVPVSLMNAGSITQESAANACIGKYGLLTVNEKGQAKLQLTCRCVTMGTLTDYAYDYKIYQDGTRTGTTEDVTVIDKYDSAADVTVAKTINGADDYAPKTISFTIPTASLKEDGLYINMFVDAMGTNTDAYLKIDYAQAKESGDSSLNYTTDKSTVSISQFGGYDVNVTVSVTDGQISDVTVTGSDFQGAYAENNEDFLSMAADGSGSQTGMKKKLIGLYANDNDKINSLDVVSGATYSSNAIKEAVMNALGIPVQKEVLADAPSESLAAGLYTISMKDITSSVEHSLVGTDKKETAYLRVDQDGKTWLSYKMYSGDEGGSLYVLGCNGYYKNNEGDLVTDGLTCDTESMDIPTIGSQDVVTDVTMPLDSLRQTYTNNVSLYVDKMKALNGTVSGIDFDHGKFSIDSTITMYWDTLKKVSSADSTFASLADGVYKLNGSMVKVDQATESMSNNAINHVIKLTVKNGLYYITMNFNSMNVSGLKGYLKDLAYYESGYTKDKWGNPVGTKQAAAIDSYQTYSDGTKVSDDFGSDYPNQITFPLCQEAVAGSSYVPMHVFVPIMESITEGNGDQDVYLKLDYSSIVKTTDKDADFNETEKAAVNPATETKEKETQAKETEAKETQAKETQAKETQSTEKETQAATAADQKTADTAPAFRVGQKLTYKGNTYTVTAYGKTNKVTLTKVKAAKSISIPATIKSGKTSFKVTAIGKSAFSAAKKKLVTVTVGANVTTIGKSAWSGCSKLKTINIKTSVLKSVGSKALSGISKKAVIKVPKAKKKAYKKLFKGKGQKSTVKVK